MLQSIELETLESLASSLSQTKDLRKKQELLLSYPTVSKQIGEGGLVHLLSHAADLSMKIALFSILAIKQDEILFAYPSLPLPKEKIRLLLTQLVAIDRFYESIGGIVGYHVHVLKFLSKKQEDSSCNQKTFSRAVGIDLTSGSKEVQQAIWDGIRALDEIAEIYPIGGLGSRLNLMSKNFETLPVACLPFCGRTLLEGLIRDVQAREFLFYRLFKRQVTIPIGMMTSYEKNNMTRVRMVCKKRKWFGRPQQSFKLFSQLSVPVVTQEGKWSMRAPLEINLQPGGHGALWKAAEERGVFFWLQAQEKNTLIIRQINNPIAGIDFGLLALVGTGKKEKKAFGFASCERLVNAAEGVLVHVKDENGSTCLSNIEYTDFKKYGIEDHAVKGGYSLYPANTNILYADLKHILPVLKKNPLPGLMLNMKNKEPYLCPTGAFHEVLGGRLESMMQNISDALISGPQQPLPTFLTYNERKRTISVTKKSFEMGKPLLETPEGAFYDLMHNAYELLSGHCGVHLEPFCTQDEYLKMGPSILFLYHPALGPLYTLIAQKIRKGRFASWSEMQLEIADVFFENLNLDGSLLVHAKNVLGHDSQGIIRYSHHTGKCYLKDVQVINKGIHRKLNQVYWKNQIKRQQALRIILQGHSEFYAEGIIFKGGQTIVVPHGERWIASQSADGSIQYHVEKAGWKWEYQEEGENIKFFRGRISRRRA
jgi:UTP---glucose-1-phosphate uridylyltransferase